MSSRELSANNYLRMTDCELTRSLIIDDLLGRSDCPTENTLFFYCDYADPPSLHPANMYRALLQQLFLKSLMSEATVQSVVETLRTDIHGLSEQKLVSVLCNAIQSCASLHVVVDGLDECERDVQQAVTDILCRLMTIGHPSVKVLVTCRDEGHLLTRLSNFDRLQISSHTSAADIHSYVSHAIASRLSSGDLALRDPNLKDVIVSKLSNNAQGMYVHLRKDSLSLSFAEIIRFLWVHFQIIELCDAASDEGIREILEDLPVGLYNTYTRIFKRIAKTGLNTTALKIMMWMVCSRRLLRVEELQEAVAFDAHDKSWNADKIPNADKMIKSCYGLVIRDTEKDVVRLAHHTVQQCLVSPQGKLPTTGSEGFDESTASIHFWPELYNFSRDPESAEAMAATLCVTYLCFSDFSTAVSRPDDKKLDLTVAFKDRGPVSIPAALGLRKHLHSLPYKFFGGNSNFKMPDIDYSKYLNVKPRDRRPSPEFRKKFALLDYVIEYWPWHTRWLQWSSESRLATQFWDLVQHGTLAFEFRPWGSNQHFGPYGCKGCPVPEPDDLEPKDLPSIGLVHWAAETGHLKVFDIIEPPLQEYLKHERHHDETLLIACRHGQFAVVEILLTRRTFDLSDGRAILSTCTSGNTSLFERLLEAQEATSDLGPNQASFSVSDFQKFGPVALYQAARDGHKDIVKILLAKKCMAHVSDTVTGLTPLQIAAMNGHLPVVRAFCAFRPQKFLPKSNMDTSHKINGLKALRYAAASGHVEIVALLLSYGWACDDQDTLGESALIKASKHGQAMVVKALLEGGAAYYTRGGENYRSDMMISVASDLDDEIAPRPTAAHHAAANGHDKVLALLPDLTTWTCGHKEYCAIHLGAAYGHADVVQTLISQGAPIDTTDRSCMTPLHYASYNGHVQVVQLLLNRGCKVDFTAAVGFQALHFASTTARSEIIRLLVAHGAAIDAITMDSRDFSRTQFPLLGNKISLGAMTPLRLAVDHSDADTIRTLVDCGAALDEQDRYGQTALDQAVGQNKIASALALIELGAKWVRHNTFWSAMRQDNKIVETLLSKLETATLEEQTAASAIFHSLSEEEWFRRNTTSRLKFQHWEKKWRDFNTFAKTGRYVFLGLI